MLAVMLLFAASVIEQAGALPHRVWVNLALALLLVFVAIILIRFVAQMNKLVLGGIIVMVLIVVGFQWIYERNEPAFLTPAINAIAGFFPSKPEIRH